MNDSVNNLCPHCGAYYQGTQHDCFATPDHPLFDSAPLAEKLDAKVEELKSQADTVIQQPTSVLDAQVGGSHYKSMKIQPIEYSYANGIGFIEGGVIKYVSRWRKKGGLEDIKKAIQMLQQLVELEEKHGTL